jgi:diphthine synthase
MSVAVAATQLVQVIERMREEGDSNNLSLFNESSMAVGLARLGSDSQQIVYCSLKDMQSVEIGKPLHSLVIPGKMHPLESEFVNMFQLNSE